MNSQSRRRLSRRRLLVRRYGPRAVPGPRFVDPAVSGRRPLGSRTTDKPGGVARIVSSSDIHARNDPRFEDPGPAAAGVFRRHPRMDREVMGPPRWSARCAGPTGWRTGQSVPAFIRAHSELAQKEIPSWIFGSGSREVRSAHECRSNSGFTGRPTLAVIGETSGMRTPMAPDSALCPAPNPAPCPFSMSHPHASGSARRSYREPAGGTGWMALPI